MITKYFKIIEFYLETEKKDQVKIARKEVQNVLDAYNKMKTFMALDFKNYEKDKLMVEILKEIDIDMTKPKTQKRLEKLRISKVRLRKSLRMDNSTWSCSNMLLRTTSRRRRMLRIKRRKKKRNRMKLKNLQEPSGLRACLGLSLLCKC